MSDNFSQWLSKLAEGDEDVAQEIWDDYYGWMVRFAQRKLKRFAVSRSDYDEEDVASDAMCDFYCGMEKRQFHDLHDRDNLRQLLFTITVRKVNDRRKHYFTQKRGGGQVLDEFSLKTQPRYKKEGINGFHKKQPTPEQEVSNDENLQQMLQTLPNATLRQIAIMTLDNISTKKIAGKLRISLQTVYNNRDKIRHILLVRMIGTEPIPELVDDIIAKYQFQLNKLDDDHRRIVEYWLKGITPRKIADKLGCMPADVYSKLGYIARIWKDNR